MNYYFEDHAQRTNDLEKQLIESADRIVTLYMSGKAKGMDDSLKLTKDYLECFSQLVTGTRVAVSNTNDYVAAIKKALEKTNPENIKSITNEFYLSVGRLGHMTNGRFIPDFGYEHNARFVDWTLRLVGLTKKTAFHEVNKQVLSSKERVFTLSDEEKYQGKKRMFYRNAYFAERYSHKTYTDEDPEGIYDMYTPLILSRMAVEQYIRYLFEKKIGTEYPDSSAGAREILTQKGIIDPVFNNELRTVMHRGNDNTHAGFANYAFTVIHAKAVVKRCFMELQLT